MSSKIFSMASAAMIGLSDCYDSTSLILDADGEEIGLKYYPLTTSPITHVDMYFTVGGDPTGINFRFRVESDSADYPSGSVLGAATAEWAGPASSGFVGEKALATNTGNLTLNTPVWIIAYRSSGGSLSGTNKISTRGYAQYAATGPVPRGRIYTSGAWNATAVGNRLTFIVKHADGSYGGIPVHSIATTPSVATHIYGDYYHGIRFKVGSQFNLKGFCVKLTKAGTPSDLVAAVYEGDTLKHSVTIPAASIITVIPFHVFFSSPVLLAADTNIYLILKQDSDGGDNSNDYSTHVGKTDYAGVACPSDMRFVYGDWSTAGSVPSGLTVSDTDVPYIVPFGLDPASDLDMTGGAPRFGDMTGGLR